MTEISLKVGIYIKRQQFLSNGSFSGQHVYSKIFLIYGRAKSNQHFELFFYDLSSFEASCTHILFIIDATDALLTQLKKVSYPKALLTALYATCQKYLQ